MAPSKLYHTLLFLEIVINGYVKQSHIQIKSFVLLSDYCKSSTVDTIKIIQRKAAFRWNATLHNSEVFVQSI